MAAYLLTETEPNKVAAAIRIDHLIGSTVTLLHSNYLFGNIKRGAKGTVMYVDDCGGLHIKVGQTQVILFYNRGDRWTSNDIKKSAKHLVQLWPAFASVLAYESTDLLDLIGMLSVALT